MEPKDNTSYATSQYWESRFQKQEQYDWLGTLKDFQDLLFAQHPVLLERKDKPVLILGCGNSTLSYDLHLLGFTDITSIDYSTTVIDKMKEKYNNISGLKWVMQDMKNMSALQSESYYFILEKGALDAFMAKQGDVWSPDQEVLIEVAKALKEVRRLLKPYGMYVQISFQQPHFRKRYLAVKDSETDLQNYDCNSNMYKWYVSHKELGYGIGYFMYTCKPY